MRYLQLLVILLPAMALSVQSSTLEQEFNKCKAITDSDLKRLTCYDAINIATAVQDKTPTSMPTVAPKPTPVAPVVSQPPATTQTVLTKKERFGLKEAREDRESESIRATVTKTKKNGYGKLTIYLDIGQVWKQNESSSIRIKKNDIVVIKQAAFDSYLMNKEGTSRSMRVKRLK